MREVLSALGLIVVPAGVKGATTAQKSADGDIVAVVRAAIASRECDARRKGSRQV